MKQQKSSRWISILLSFCMVSMTLFVPAFAEVVNFTDPGLLPDTDSYNYEPYPVALNATSYTPWFTMYHMETAGQQANGVNVDDKFDRRGGEGGQMIMSFGISPSNPNLMLMGSDMGGIWRSTDGGENWYSMTKGVNMRATMGFAFHPENENIAYSIQSVKGVSSSDLTRLKNSTIDGVYRSLDGGITWEQVLNANVLCNANSQSLIQFDAQNNVYVLTSWGLYKSLDNGETWNELAVIDGYSDEANTTKVQGSVYSLYVSDDGQTLMTATGTSGISYSSDGGTTWEKRNGTLTSGSSSLAVDPKDETHWYAIFAGVLYESLDSGLTWITSNFGDYTPTSACTPYVVKAYYPTGQTEKPRLVLLYGTLSRPIRYSNDGGATWKEPTSSAERNDSFTKSTGYYVEALAICESNPDITLYSYGDVIYKSTNGGASYQWSNAGYSGNYIRDIDVAPDGKLWISFRDRELAFTNTAYQKGTYPTATLIDVDSSQISGDDVATVNALTIDPDDPTHMFLAGGSEDNHCLYESTNSGQTWNAVTDADGVAIRSGSGVSCNILEYHKTNSDIIYTTSHKSTDGGVTWTHHQRDGANCTIVAVSPNNSDVVYSYKQKSSSNTYPDLYKSTDGGATWTCITPNDNPKIYSKITSVMVDRTNDNVLWVGQYGGQIYKVTYNPETGTSTRTSYASSAGVNPFGAAANAITTIVQNPNNTNHLLAGTTCSEGGTKTSGLYESTNGGTTWRVVKGLSSARNVQRIFFVGGVAFLGTCSQGTILYDYELYQRYLNGETVIRPHEILLPGDENKVRVMLDGTTLSFANNEMPYIQNNMQYLPAAKILQRDGYTVTYDAENGVLTATKDSVTVTLTKDATAAMVGENTVTLTAAPQEQNGILFVPMSFFSELTNTYAYWNESLKKVQLTHEAMTLVTFAPGEGVTDVVAATVPYETGSIVALGKTLTRDGYTVTGWIDASGNTYAIGDAFTITGACTLTAVWEEVEVTDPEPEPEPEPDPEPELEEIDATESIVAEYVFVKEAIGDTTTQEVFHNVLDVTQTTAGVDLNRLNNASGNDRWHLYKFSIDDWNSITAATLKLTFTKTGNTYVNAYVYAMTEEAWNLATTGTTNGVKTLDSTTGLLPNPYRDSFTALTSKRVTSASKLSTTTTFTISAANLLSLVTSQEAAGGDVYLAVGVHYNGTTKTAYLCNPLHATENYRPTLTITGTKLVASDNTEAGNAE